MNETLAAVVGEFREAIAPFRVACASSAELQALFARYGWDVDIAGGEFNAVKAAFALEPLIEELLRQTDALIYGTDAERLAAIGEVLKAVQNLGARFSSFQGATAASAPFDGPLIWAELARCMVGDLVVTYIERRQPIIFALAHAFGIVRFDRVSPVGDFRMPYVCGALDFEQFGRLFTDPAKAVRDLYGWGGASFDHRKLLTTFERILLALGANAEMGPPRRDLAQGRIDLALAAQHHVRQLDGYLLHGVDSVGVERWRVGVRVLPVPAQPGAGAPTGLVLTPLFEGAASAAIELGSGVEMQVSGAVEGDNALVVRLMPDGVSAQLDVGLTAFAMQVALVGRPEQPYVLFGARGETRLELDSFRFEAGVDGTLAAPEIYFRLDLGAEQPKLRLVLNLSDTGDGFIGRVIGKELSAAFGLDVLWSSRSGVRIGGNAQFSFQLPFVIDLGFLKIGPLTVAARGSAAGAAFGVGVDAALTLGPLFATVQNIGAELALTPAADGRGAFGPLDIAVAFKPPDGIGLTIDASVVKGGGFIKLEPAIAQYSGVLQLAIQKTIDVKAIGILNARLPSGNLGFSLLLIITAEFPPIQLGMGFTLNGIGGLAGINRTAAVDVLRAGLRNGALDTMLFPRDPLANVPALLSTLGSVFPVAEGRYVFGPMVRIGWGSPAILTLDVAVLIELPDPVRIILLGRLKAALPDEKKPVAVIRMDALGVLDFGRKELSLDATIYDSKILTFTLSGDMALRLSWGANPGFLLSVGGFHPHFQPPASMPALARMALVLVDFEKDGVTARVRLDSYFAITSNTVQFGAHVQAYVKVLAVEVQGLLGFDALVHFPFAIDAQMVAAVTLSFNGALLMGAEVALNLTGPGPWHLVGEARFVFLGLPARAHIDFTSGSGSATTAELPPPADVAAQLIAALKDARNWQPVLAEALPRVARLAPAAAGAGELLMHPLAGLAVRQRVAPLGVLLARYGNAPIAGGLSRFQLQLNLANAATAPLREAFAMGQYQVLSDSEKLARPSFEEADAGLQVQVNDFGFAADAVLVVPAAVFEDRLVDPASARLMAPPMAAPRRRARALRLPKLPKVQAQAVQAYLDTRAAAGLAPRTHSGKGRYAPVPSTTPV